jgi:transcriptional regulator with XRE-family HTH domain
MEHFGQRLIRLRTQRGLSRYGVAKGTGLSHQLVAHLETMDHGGKVRGDTLRKLATFFGLTIEELLGPEEEGEQHAA